MNEEWLDNLEDTIEDFPEEVRDFIFGDELKNVKEDLKKQVNSEEEGLELTNMVMFFLLQGKTEKELDDFIENMTISDDQKMAIRAIIQEKVINELILIIEANEVPGTQSETKGKGDVYASLAERLKQATITTPITHNYTSRSTNNSSATTSAIDPYHEPIDNE